MTSATAPPLSRVARWLAIALGANVLLSIALVLGLHANGESWRQAARATVVLPLFELRNSTAVDSWHPMWVAYQQMVAEPDSDLYRIFFVDDVKFQYPPSSLLVFDVFPDPLLKPGLHGELPPTIRNWINWLSRAAVLVTIVATLLILKLGLERMRSEGGEAQPPRAQLLTLAIGGALALTFYPMLKGYQLGQIQVFMNAVIAFGLLCYLRGREALAGACIGLCCLVKPQCALVLVWGLLRRRVGFLVGASLVLGLGLAVSMERFGFANHLRYLEVLLAISRDGESYWPNQSMNGFLHRLLGNGSALEFSPTTFAPYHPVVHALTLLSSAAIVILVFWLRGGAKRASGGPIDLALALIASTIASPVAWEHHFGALVAVFALALPYAMGHRPFGRATAPLLLVSYVAVANVFLRPELLFVGPWLGILGAHLYFGTLVLFALLLGMRSASGALASGSTDSAAG